MVGRQTPILAVVVPLILVAVIDGRRGVRQTWPAALTAGVVFGVFQFLASNYVSVPLTDIIAALVSAAAVVLLLRVWRPAESPDLGESPAEPSPGSADIGATGNDGVDEAGSGGGVSAGRGRDVIGSGDGSVAGGGGGVGTIGRRDTGAEVARAYAPYLIIIAIFSIANISAVKAALAKEPWTVTFGWPGLHVLGKNGKPLSSLTFSFGWLAAAGTLLILAGILTAIVLRVSPGRAVRAYGRTYVELRHAIVTVMAVLALAYVLNQSGQTNTLGEFLAAAGGVFIFLSSILGWIGVAVTGSDTSANALFGALQVQTAAQAGLDPVLLAAANSSGGVLGKMISPQNLAIAASAVGMAGREGDIFRRVVGWSLLLLLIMCVLVTLQGTAVLGWMVP
jgi:lactate permease